jgi:hypothetical protein
MELAGSTENPKKTIGTPNQQIRMKKISATRRNLQAQPKNHKNTIETPNQLSGNASNNCKKTDFIIVITLDSLEFNYLLCFNMFFIANLKIL